MKKLEAIALMAAMASPLIYFSALVLSSIFYPGYNQSRQLVSELGASGAPHPEILNVGIMIYGASLLLGAFGYFGALRRLGANSTLNWLISSILILFGISGVMAGLFPLPDPRHAGKYLGLVNVFGPILLTAALWKRSEVRVLNAYLVVTGIATFVALAVMMGVGGLRTQENLGIVQRVFALAGLPWIGIAAYVLSSLITLNYAAEVRS